MPVTYSKNAINGQWRATLNGELSAIGPFRIVALARLAMMVKHVFPEAFAENADDLRAEYRDLKSKKDRSAKVD